MNEASTEAKTERMLQRQLDKGGRYLPGTLRAWVAYLRQPGARRVRVPIGILLVLGGLLSILPVLGIWMLPLGLVLLALDIPLLRRPVARTLIYGQRVWERLRRGRGRATRS